LIKSRNGETKLSYQIYVLREWNTSTCMCIN